MDFINPNPLANEFKVACAVYGFQIRHEPVGYKKLMESLQNNMDKKMVEQCIDTLFDWGILRAEYGETENGQYGRVLTIDQYSKPKIRYLYNHWVEPLAPEDPEDNASFE